MRLIEVVIVKHHSTCSLNPFQNQITALLKCQYLESVRGGRCGEVRGWSQRVSGRGGEREREREREGVRLAFRFLFSRLRLDEARQMFYFFRCRRRRRTVCVQFFISATLYRQARDRNPRNSCYVMQCSDCVYLFVRRM